MNAKKFYYILVSALILLSLGVGIMAYFGNKLMKKSSETLVNAKLDNLVNEKEEASYTKAKKDLETYKELSTLVAKILPQDKDQARAVSEIYKIGSETGVKIAKIEFPTSTLGQKATSKSPSATTNTSSTVVAGGVTQAKAVEGLKSVLGIDINIGVTSDTTYTQLQNFLQKIESNRRSMQIKKISVRPNVEKNVLTFELTVTIFVKQ